MGSSFVFAFFPVFSMLFMAALPLHTQPLEWESRGFGGGGALFSPSISPHDNAEMYVACDMTEMFHTTNYGASWEVLPFYRYRAIRDSRIGYTSDPDLLGRVVLEHTLEAAGASGDAHITLDVARLQPGMYFLTAISGPLLRTEKLLIR